MEEKTNETTTNVKSHNKNGKFAPGNKLSPGNPYVKKVASFRSALYSCVTVADFKVIIKTAVEQAKQGDRESRKWLVDRLLGKATTHIEASVNSEHIKHFIGVDLTQI